jgi:putative ABC transport system substrate-binding protein
MKATSTIPIIFAGVYDPESMQIAGKNATGISSTVSVRNLLEDLKSIQAFSKLGVIFNKSEKDTILQAGEVSKLEGPLGFKTVLFNVVGKVDKAAVTGIDALFLTTTCAGMSCAADVVGIARRDKIPTASTIGGGENRGILLTLTADPEEQGTEAAKIVAKVLKGTPPSDIPIQAPKKIEKIINLREAGALGFKVPSDLLSSAARVIK